ncbi:MAG: SDR family oxidoreductase [Litorimonas sp.]
MDKSLEGKTVLITGGANNLGAAVAADLAHNGVGAIAIHYHSEKSRKDAEVTEAVLKSNGVKTAVLTGDLRTAGAMTTLFDQAEDVIGKIDIGIHTVGKVIRKPIVEISESEYDHMFDVNAKSTFFFLKECGQRMNDHGRIVTIATSLLGAFTGLYSTYGGAKAPLEHFTRAAAKEFGERGISVNAVAPGPMDTEFFYPAENPKSIAMHKMLTALSDYSSTGLTDVEDIVPYIRMIVSEGWWMTGQTVLINGGYTHK